MTYTVHYGRFGGRYDDTFDTFEEAVGFIETQEERDAIFAAAIIDEDGPLWESRHPLAAEGRWFKAREDAPDWDWTRP